MAAVASSFSRPLVYGHFLRNKYNYQVEEELRSTEPSNKAMVPVLDHIYDYDNNNQVVPGFVIPLFKDDGPWEIKKLLTESDVNNLSRLLVPRGIVENYIFPYWDDELVQLLKGDDGYSVEVTVREFDTMKEHTLKFKKWPSNSSYVFQGAWKSEFVKAMRLEVGDEIGMFWNSEKDCFFFKLLKKHASTMAVAAYRGELDPDAYGFIWI